MRGETPFDLILHLGFLFFAGPDLAGGVEKPSRAHVRRLG